MSSKLKSDPSKPTPLSPVMQSMVPPDNGYIARWLTSEQTDLDMLEYFWKSNIPVLLEGPSGAGKTSALIKFAHEHNLPWVPVSCDGAATTDTLFGRFIPSANNTLRWVDGPVTLAFREGGLLHLDEINMLHPRIASSLHSAFDFRRHLVLMEHPVTHWCEEHGHLRSDAGHEKCKGLVEWSGPYIIPAHPRLFVTGAYNRNYQGTRQLNEAFANRFIQLEYDYSPEIEERLVQSPVLRELAKKLRDSQVAGQIRTPISTNRLITFEQLVDDLGYEEAKQIFLWNFPAEERSVVANVWNDALERRLMDDYGFAYVEED